MKRILLIALCTLCILTAFSQNVRTKPVVKKQTTTKVATKSTTKKPVGKKKTTKKKKSYNYYYDDYAVDSVAYEDAYADSAAVALPQLSESAAQLATYLVCPLGTIEMNMLDKSNSYQSIADAVKQNYVLSSNSDNDEVWVYEHDNPTLNIKYHGLPFHYFTYKYSTNSNWYRSVTYTFEIRKNDMTRGLYDYLDLIVSDLNELGFPISYQKKSDQYLKAKGEIRVDNVEIEIEVNDYYNYQYQIKLYLY
jgi:hypothetical protein